MEQCKGVVFRELSHRVFGIYVAYRARFKGGKSNSVLVTGESGLVRQKQLKGLMHYLAYLGGRKGTEGRSYLGSKFCRSKFLKHLAMQKQFPNNTSKEDFSVLWSQDYLANYESDVIGISQKEQDAIFRFVAAILLLKLSNFHGERNLLDSERCRI